MITDDDFSAELTVSYSFEKRENGYEFYKVVTDFEATADFLSEIDATTDLVNGRPFDLTKHDNNNFILKINTNSNG